MDFLEPGGPSFKEAGDIGRRVLSHLPLLWNPLGCVGKRWIQPKIPFPDQVTAFRVDLIHIKVFWFGGLDTCTFVKNRIIWGYIYLHFVLEPENK